MTYYTVYKIINNVNGKFYIGVHVTDDLDDNYMGSGTVLDKAKEKYGIDNFKKEYLHIFNSKEDMFKMESVLVDENFVKNTNTYNIRKGGIGSWDYVNLTGLNNKNDQCYWLQEKLNEDLEYKKNHSKKISQALKNCGFDFSKHSSNKKHTDESKRKIGKANSKHQSGSGNSQYGTMWIYNETLKESKRINKTDSIPNGWQKGRKLKF